MNVNTPHSPASAVQSTANQPPPDITQEMLDEDGLTLTPAQKKNWEDTMTLMAWTCPGFRHLFYKLLSQNKGEFGAIPTTRIPVAATDARNILINPEPFFKYPLKQRVFIMGHEIVHNVYGDVEFLKQCGISGTVPMSDGSTLPFRNSTMQKAMDYRINALLRDGRIGEPPPDCLLDDTIATANDSVVDSYKKVYEDEENGGQKTGKNPGFDYILAPGSTNGTPQQPRNPEQWGVEIAAANVLEQMKAQGKMNGALQRMFKELLEPIVPWTDHIRGIFNRKVGSGSYNWRRPDRRFIVRDIHMPSRSGNGAGWVVCWGDTSGSIGNDELCKYLSELGSIVEECKPQRLTVIWCDSKIGVRDDGSPTIDEIEDAADLKEIQYGGPKKAVKGGGGTAVDPVFDWISESADQPEIFIGFTDGFVTFPDQPPPYTCLWAMTTSKVAPFGETIPINPVRA